MAEKFRKNIYCEKEFLELCFLKSEVENISASDFDEYNIWRNLKKMILRSNIKLHLNVSKEYLSEIKNKKPSELVYIDKKIFEVSTKRLANGNYLDLSNFVINDTFFEHNEDEKLTSICLSCQSYETCKELMDSYGVLTICPENIMDFKQILSDNGMAIRKNDENVKNWKNVLKYASSTCNSIALVDNYILVDKSLMEENLIKIFDTLLPQSLADIPFQISIFSTFKDGCDSKKLFETIASKIEQLRPNLYFKLSIFKVSKDKFHDRTLITNNFYISCGGGFDLFKQNKPSKTTTVNVVYPYLNNFVHWTSTAYSNFISEVSEEFNKSTEYKNEYLTGFFRGDKTNRLLNQIAH